LADRAHRRAWITEVAAGGLPMRSGANRGSSRSPWRCPSSTGLDRLGDLLHRPASIGFAMALRGPASIALAMTFVD